MSDEYLERALTNAPKKRLVRYFLQGLFLCVVGVLVIIIVGLLWDGLYPFLFQVLDVLVEVFDEMMFGIERTIIALLPYIVIVAGLLVVLCVASVFIVFLGVYGEYYFLALFYRIQQKIIDDDE